MELTRIKSIPSDQIGYHKHRQMLFEMYGYVYSTPLRTITMEVLEPVLGQMEELI